MSTVSASTATAGRVRHTRLPASIVSASILLASTRQMASIVTPVFPSAAEPNIAKGSPREKLPVPKIVHQTTTLMFNNLLRDVKLLHILPCHQSRLSIKRRYTLICNRNHRRQHPLHYHRKLTSFQPIRALR